MKKISVGIIFGGKSSEHRVSLQSAKNIVEAIDQQLFDISLIGIDENGRWRVLNPLHYLENDKNPKLISMVSSTSNDL